MQLAYVHIIEPREDTFISEEEKLKYLQGRAEKSGTVLQDWTTLRVFRRELGGEMGTVMVSAGGYDLDNPFEVVESGDADAVAYGRWFISNPDLPERIRNNVALTKYDRSTFYTGGAEGYITYNRAAEMQPQNIPDHNS